MKKFIRGMKKWIPEVFKKDIRKLLHWHEHSKAVSKQRNYYKLRDQFIKETLGTSESLNLFLDDKQLPKEFGVYYDERVIEYPWLLSRLQTSSSKLLDLGSVLNFDYIIDHVRARLRQVTIATLEPEPCCFWHKGISYVFCDARELPFQSNHFDEVVCLSTIEHVGFDNTRYYSKNLAHKENNPEAYLQVLREISRVLKPGGTLYLTLPVGRRIDYGWFQQFDLSMLDQLSSQWGSKPTEETYFLYDRGWRKTDKQSCSECTSFHDIPRRADDKNQPVASMAVGALKFLKPLD